MKHTRAALVAACLAVSLGLTGCSSEPVKHDKAEKDISAKAVKGGTLRVLQAYDFSHLDPAQGWDSQVMNMYRLLYRTLTTTGPAGSDSESEIVPDLATDLGTPSENNTVWTFTLKDDIFFDDGTPITSADLKFGVERSLDPKISIGSPYAKTTLKIPDGYKGIYESGPLDSIETPDPKTIVFHLASPQTEFASVVSQSPFTPFPNDKAKITETSVDKQPVSSGPYSVKSYKHGSSLVLERNKFWKQSSDDVRTAAPDSFEFVIGLDPATIDERLLAGQGQDRNAIGDAVQASTLPRLNDPAIQKRVIAGQTGCTSFLQLDVRKPGMKDERVRQAIAWAIDRESTKTANGGSQVADIATTLLPPTIPGYKKFDDFPSPDNHGDPEKAKALLAEAGYPNGFTFTADLAASPTGQSRGSSIQEALKRAGITLKLNPIDPSTFYEVVGAPAKQHDAVFASWCPDWLSGSTFIPPLLEGSQIFDQGNSNRSMFNDPEINARIQEIRKLGVDEANKAWGDLDEVVMKKAPLIPLLNGRAVSVVGANVAEAHPSPAFQAAVDLSIVGLRDGGRG